jgi:hypothetical protein
MYKNAFIAAVAITAFSLTSFAHAQAQAIPPTVVQKAPDMGPMHFLVGTWTCRAPGEMSTLNFTQSADGMWMLGNSQMTTSSGDKTQAHLYMTYDNAARQWVILSTNSAGGYGLAYSTGMQGDTAQFKSSAKGGMQGDVMMMKRISDTQLQITQSNPDKTGYQRMQTYTCDKSGG